MRQLTTKYLEKKEENKYNLEIQCFKPFLSISQKTKDDVIKEYIIYCVINIIKNNDTKIQKGWTIILNIFSEVHEQNNDNNLQKQILDILEHVALNNYKQISEIFEQYINCLKLYVDKFPEKVNKIMENFITKVENEKNFKILINAFMKFLLNNNEFIRKKSLENLSKCFESKFKLINSNLYELGKNPNFWKYLLNQVIIPTISEMIKKISSLNSSTNINNISISTFNSDKTPEPITKSLSNKDNNEEEPEGLNQKNNIENEKNKFCMTLKDLLIQIVNIFNYFFSYNYKELITFFESLEKIVFNEDEQIQTAGLECVKYLNNCEKMKNQYFLETFSLFLISLSNKSLEESMNNIELKDIENCIKMHINNNLLNKNLSMSFVHFKVLNLLDKLLSQNIYFLNDEVLNKLLDCLEASIYISNNFNGNINLRFKITEYNQKIGNNFSKKNNEFISDDEIFNLFKQFQMAYKNFYFIAEFLYNKDNGISNKQKYYKKIMEMSIKSIKIYNNKNKEFINLINKSNNEKEAKEKEAELNNYVISLNDYIFPSIQKIEFYKDSQYRDIICKLFFDLILCYDQRIREKVKDMLGVVFDVLYKNS